MKTTTLIAAMLLSAASVFASEKVDTKFQLYHGSDKGNFAEWQTDAKSQWGFDINTPDGYSKGYMLNAIVYDDPSALSGISTTNYATYLVSKDKNCMILLPCFEYEQGFTRRTEIMPLIKREISNAMGCEQKDLQNADFDSVITSLSATAAKRLANADRLYVVDFPLTKPIDKKWTHCQGIYMEKDGRPAMTVKVLYSDKGFGRANSVMSDALGIMKYDSRTDWVWPKLYKDRLQEGIAQKIAKNKNVAGK